jgi:hypothetical protein
MEAFKILPLLNRFSLASHKYLLWSQSRPGSAQVSSIFADFVWGRGLALPTYSQCFLFADQLPAAVRLLDFNRSFQSEATEFRRHPERHFLSMGYAFFTDSNLTGCRQRMRGVTAL